MAERRAPIGAVFIDKAGGITSFSALGAVKRAVGTRKVGHTGTLDPFATGLLLALVGPATRTARYFNGLPKRYDALFVFGSETDTDDRTGSPTRETDLPSAARVRAALDTFRGEIEQLPPAFSAVHVDGRRAHEIARRGEEPRLATRNVTVHDLRLVDEATEHGLLKSLRLEIACSAGTYIRSIARDLGRAVGSSAHVGELRRTEIGPFGVGEAVPADGLQIPRHLNEIARVLERLPNVASVAVGDATALSASNGRRIAASDLDPSGSLPTAATTIVLTHHGEALAIGRMEEDGFVYDIVFPRGGES
ncbi:MAG: tRNA pseudouridine(55) synthase TruB [Spirochaetota bacterium]